MTIAIVIGIILVAFGSISAKTTKDTRRDSQKHREWLENHRKWGLNVNTRWQG